MRRLLIALFFLMTLSNGRFAVAQPTAFGRVEGRVEVTRGAITGVPFAQSAILPGDHIRVADNAQAELLFERDTVVTAGSGTELVVRRVFPVELEVRRGFVGLQRALPQTRIVTPLGTVVVTEAPAGPSVQVSPETLTVAAGDGSFQLEQADLTRVRFTSSLPQDRRTWTVSTRSRNTGNAVINPYYGCAVWVPGFPVDREPAPRNPFLPPLMTNPLRPPVDTPAPGGLPRRP